MRKHGAMMERCEQLTKPQQFSTGQWAHFAQAVPSPLWRHYSSPVLVLCVAGKCVSISEATHHHQLLLELVTSEMKCACDARCSVWQQSRVQI